MARIVSQQGEKGELQAGVAFAESVDGVELRQEMGGLVGEGWHIEALQEVVFLQFAEQLGRLAFDVLGKAKRIATLGHANGTRLASPLVDILKQVMVDGLIMRKVMRKVEIPFGQRFVGPCARNFGFKRIQLSLVAQVELVYQDG